MTTKSVTLIGVANVFVVHPRTIVRAITGEHNTYWTDDINEDLFAVADISKAYGMNTNELVRCIEGRDKLIKPDEAAAILEVQPRTFRDRVKGARMDGRRPYGRAAAGGVVRYLRSKVIEAKIATQE